MIPPMTTKNLGSKFEPYEEAALPMHRVNQHSSEMVTQPRLTAYYLSRGRVLGLLELQRLPAHVLAALQGQDVAMSSGILANAVGIHVMEAIRAGRVRSLVELAFEGQLKAGTPFIYEGHVYGKGFAFANKSPQCSLSEKLDAPLVGRKLVVEFSKGGITH